MASDRNPFHIHGVVTGAFFTNRADEVARIRRTLREPGSKLLLYGPRRMGKTSALAHAIERHRAAGGVALLADLSTATAAADVANRLLEAAGVALGRKWKDVVTDLVARVGVSVTLAPDPATGLVVPSVDVSLRAAPDDAQRASIARVLDAIEALAHARKTPIGVVIDEFQEIRRFGGDDAEWHLRGVVQHHRRVSYVFAGSEAHLMAQMLDKGHAFYGLADPLQMGPINSAHLARWIDERLTGAGVRASGVGAAIIARAGPRTRDVVQVARRCHDNQARARRASATDVAAAFDDVVAEQVPVIEALWSSVSPLQQNVLRAVAADVAGLTTAESRRRFALTSSGAVTKAAQVLVDRGYLVRAETASGYQFENPFVRRWVEMRPLADIGGLSGRPAESI
jgi:hypothetical protein